jgi:hypothetical protein
MRRFLLVRDADLTGISGTGAAAPEMRHNAPP